MSILSRLAATLQVVFGPLAEAAATTTKVIQRKRKFTASTLAQVFTLGYLRKPNASDADLARVAHRAGVDVTESAIEQRHTPEMVAFLKELFDGVAQQIVAADHALTPLLDRFTHVHVMDSTCLNLPATLAKKYPGCGRNTTHANQAALKLQTTWNLKTGALHIEQEAGCTTDQATQQQHAEPEPGSLRIADLGYFALPVLQQIADKKALFLSRLQFGTNVYLPGQATAATTAELLDWLATQPGPFVDVEVQVGSGQRLPCRLIAWRRPEEKANRARQEARRDQQSKHNKEPSRLYLEWCGWSILITNAPVTQIAAHEAVVLYRARWQIELLFKRWKSLGKVAWLEGSTTTRQMVRVWGRLCAAVMQVWFTVAGAWHNVTRSWVKVCEVCREFVPDILGALGDAAALVRVLEAFVKVVEKTCRRNKRTETGTAELLETPELLGYFA